MLENLKAMLQMREQVDALAKRFDALRGTVSAFDTRLILFERQLADTAAHHDDSIKALAGFKRVLADEAGAVQAIRKRFEAEIARFGDLKREIIMQVGRRIEAEIRHQVGEASQELSRNVSDIKSARVQLGNLGIAADAASAQVRRLTDTAGALKDQDLQLAKLFEEVKRSGDEKARLLCKIDTLERLVAKMRRGSHRGMPQHTSRL